MKREISRRNVLKSIVVVAGAGVASSVLDACGSQALGDGASYFPQSVASGDPKTDSVVLWTRVHDPAAGGDLALRLQGHVTELALDEVQRDQQCRARLRIFPHLRSDRILHRGGEDSGAARNGAHRSHSPPIMFSEPNTPAMPSSTSCRPRERSGDSSRR